LAYSDAEMLQAAQDAWKIVAAYQIDQKQANAGSHPIRNVTFSTQCNNRQSLIHPIIVRQADFL
jgi:hypothetical protein